jgi:hypothetical protein
MLKKTITYSDLEGNSVTDDFYFNLNKSELVELELSHAGGLSGHLQDLIKSEDGGKIIAALKGILSMSVGQKSEDGKRFIKSEDITNGFLQSDAYSELFMDLVSQTDGAVEFITGIIPADMAKKVVDHELPEGDAAKEYTMDALLEMTDDQFTRVAGSDPKEMSKAHLVAAMQRKNKAA